MSCRDNNNASLYGRGYSDGYEDSRVRFAYEHRIAAFGAIRRAAEVAREHERWARLHERGMQDALALGGVLHAVPAANDVRDRHRAAAATRAAIRAAIGSEKA